MKHADKPLAMFSNKGADHIYSRLITRLHQAVGADAVVDPKQTCVHFTAGEGGTAFAGVHPRKNAVLLNIRTQTPLKSSRIRKAEQVSKNRCHCELILSSVEEVNREVIQWLKDSMQLVK